MLAAHEREPEFTANAAANLKAFLEQSQQESPLVEIGPFRIVRELGSGGMGTVYLARRSGDGFEQEVAIKVIRNGLDSRFLVERFRRERRILGRLQHPCIARLLDGGSLPSGVPYLVMEKVDGKPITEYCAANALSVSKTIALFQQICDAIHYSHQNLVVHRDLKPGNVLVDERGCPKLLDFGIAKLLAQEEPLQTLGGVPVGFTPEYASPEQRHGLVVSTASDIYSLGVILHELLKGHRPGETGRGGSAGGKTLPIDLEKIIRKSLAAEPANRYNSAADLSSDLTRFLEGKPVSASTHTTRYLLSKFVVRHRALLGALATFIVCLMGTALWAVHQTTVAQEQRRRADDERKQIEVNYNELLRASDLLLNEIPDALQKIPGSTTVSAELIRESVDILNELAANPKSSDSLKAQLAAAYSRFGDLVGNPAFRNLGQTGVALSNYRKALTLRRELALRPGAADAVRRDLASSYEQVGTIEETRGDLKDAFGSFQMALSTYSGITTRRPGDRLAQRGLAEVLLDLGRMCLRQKEPQAAIGYFMKQRQIYENLVRTGPGDLESRRSLALSYKQNAVTLAQLKRFSQAHDLLAKSRSIDEQLMQMPGQSLRAKEDLAFDYSDLGGVYLSEHKLLSALQSYQKSLNIRTEIAGEDPNDAKIRRFLASSLTGMGRVSSAMGRYDDAIESFQAGIRHLLTLLSTDSQNATILRDAATSYGDLAAALMANSKARPAEQIALMQAAKQNLGESLVYWKQLANRSDERSGFASELRQAELQLAQCNRLLATVPQPK